VRGETRDAERAEDRSLLDTLEKKVTSLTGAPRPAEYDEHRTNPVTGMRREP
jgi:hypothetical protein